MERLLSLLFVSGSNLRRLASSLRDHLIAPALVPPLAHLGSAPTFARIAYPTSLTPFDFHSYASKMLRDSNSNSEAATPSKMNTSNGTTAHDLMEPAAASSSTSTLDLGPTPPNTSMKPTASFLNACTLVRMGWDVPQLRHSSSIKVPRKRKHQDLAEESSMNWMRGPSPPTTSTSSTKIARMSTSPDTSSTVQRQTRSRVWITRKSPAGVLRLASPTSASASSAVLFIQRPELPNRQDTSLSSFDRQGHRFLGDNLRYVFCNPHTYTGTRSPTSRGQMINADENLFFRLPAVPLFKESNFVEPLALIKPHQLGSADRITNSDRLQADLLLTRSTISRPISARRRALSSPASLTSFSSTCTLVVKDYGSNLSTRASQRQTNFETMSSLTSPRRDADPTSSSSSRSRCQSSESISTSVLSPPNETPKTTISAASKTSCLPPINRTTLKELDLHEILQSAQLRHDVVFDPNLMFRPNSDGERGDSKRLATDEYWHLIAQETTCGGNLMRATTTTNSRIPLLISELRDILLTLLPTPLNQEANREVMEMLDPESVCGQLERGCLDVGRLADYLGRTLKLHCAPMRDCMVDEMVTLCKGKDSNSALGLRKCFEVLELMKLDIANHQLRTLRPYLIKTAVEFERQHLRTKLTSDLSSSLRAWLLNQKTSTKTNVTIPDLLAHGTLDLIFLETISSVPLTFQHDPLRLKTFRDEALDLTILYMLMMLSQQLIPSIRERTPTFDDLRRDLLQVISTANKKVQAASMEARTFGHLGSAKLDSSIWREGIKQVAVVISSYATNLLQASPADGTKRLKTVLLIEQYLDTHLRSTSSLFILLQTRLQACLMKVIQNEHQQLTEHRITPWWITPWWISPSNVTLNEARGGPLGNAQASRRTGCSSNRDDTVIVPKDASLFASTVPLNNWQRRGIKRRFESSEEHEKRIRLSTPNTINEQQQQQRNSTRQTRTTTEEDKLDLLLARNGLTPLSSSVKSLGERIGKLTTYHLAVNGDLYQTLLKA